MLLLQEKLRNADGSERPSISVVKEVGYFGPTDKTKECLIWKGLDLANGWQVHTDGEGQFVQGHVDEWLYGMTRYPVFKQGVALWVGAASGLLSDKLLTLGARNVVEIEWDRSLSKKMRAILHPALKSPQVSSLFTDIMGLKPSEFRTLFDNVYLDVGNNVPRYPEMLKHLYTFMKRGARITIEADFWEWPLHPTLAEVFPAGDLYEDNLGWRYYSAVKS